MAYNYIFVEKYYYNAFGQPAVKIGDCTVGNTEVFATISTATNCRAMPFACTEDGVINSVSIYHNGGSGDAILAVYSDDSGYRRLMSGCN